MRLIHFSDLHLGVESYGTADPRTGMSTRVADFLAAYDAIVERAISEPVDAVLFSGDAFKTRDPSPTIQREFARRISRLARHGVPIVLLVGNHDLPNIVTRATANEIYEVLEIPGVHVCRDIAVKTIPTRSGPLQVVTLPWISRTLLLNREEYRIIAEVDLNRAIGRAVSEALETMVQQLDPGLPAVLMAHVSVEGATLGFEQSIMLGRDLTVGLEELHAKAFDYVALGHIHRHQFVGVSPPAAYAGSPERIDFGEEREPKGYLLLAIETADGGRRTAAEFVELPARPFKTIRLTAGGDAPMVAVERDLARLAGDVDGAIVRCYVTVDPGRERAVPALEVRRMLAGMGARYIAQVVVESEATGRGRWELNDESGRDSVSMLRRWVEMKDYDQALTERVLARGMELIARRRERSGGSGTDG